MLYSTYIANIKNLSKEQQRKVLVIARFYNGKENRDIRLSPSTNLLKNYKDKKISWQEYEQMFFEEMNTGEMLKALRELYIRCRNDDVIIACYEKENNFCHRRLIGEFINKYNIDYKELE